MRKIFIGLLIGAAATAMASTAQADVIYNSIPSSLPTNLPSLGYEATSTSQFGDEIQFAGHARNLTQVGITLSDWALYSSYGDQNTASFTSSAAGWSTPLTLNIYNVGAGDTVGSLIASQTINPTILWRPAADTACGSGFLGSDGQCYNGLAQNVTFDFTGTVVPDKIVYGLVFNTQNYGPTPTGASGPYNSLNFALNDTSGPSVGTDVNPDGVFWNTSYGPFLANPANGNQFAQDTNWAPYVPAAQFTAVPEPSSLALFGAALLALGFLEFRRRRATAV